MKIRNKETGEVKEGYGLALVKDKRTYDHLLATNENPSQSLAEVMEKWEDVRAPLITTNRVRELLKNWADYNDIDEVDVSKDVETGCISFSCAYAYIDFYVHEPFVKEGEHYTIEELCEGA